MNNKLVDIAFLMGSGRLNWDVEQAVMGVLDTVDLRTWNRAMKSATPDEINRMWKIVKATPAGRSLAESVVGELKKVAKGLTPSSDGYGQAWFNTETGEVRFSLADGDGQELYDEYEAVFKKVKGVKKVEGDAEIGAPKEPQWVRIRESLADLDNIIGVQTSDGNWNYDGYMHGLANGLLLGRHVGFDQDGEVPLLDPPDEWLADKGPFEAMVERAYYNGQATRQNKRNQRNADPAKQVQGAVAARDPKKAGGQRHGQRQRSARRGRPVE